MTGIAIVFTLLCLGLGALYVAACEKRRYRRAFWLKWLAGLCFVAVVLSLAMEQAGLEYPRLIFFGLVVGLVGDQLLALRYLHPERGEAFFVSGAIAFALGHVLYLRAMWGLDSGAWLFAFLLLAFGLALAYYYLLRQELDAGRLLAPGLVYIALVVAVAAMATALLIRGQGIRALLLTLGGAAFAVSDCILTVRSFGGKKTLAQSVIVHAAYYAAQLLIAWSIAA